MFLLEDFNLLDVAFLLCLQLLLDDSQFNQQVAVLVLSLVELLAVLIDHCDQSFFFNSHRVRRLNLHALDLDRPLLDESLLVDFVALNLVKVGLLDSHEFSLVGDLSTLDLLEIARPQRCVLALELRDLHFVPAVDVLDGQ